MKILLGIVIGAGLMFGGVAFAGETGISVRDFGFVGGTQAGQYVSKFVDPDNGNVCYLSGNGNRGGISCLHN